jgi:hypothetical protein
MTEKQIHSLEYLKNNGKLEQVKDQLMEVISELKTMDLTNDASKQYRHNAIWEILDACTSVNAIISQEGVDEIAHRITSNYMPLELPSIDIENPFNSEEDQ